MFSTSQKTKGHGGDSLASMAERSGVMHKHIHTRSFDEKSGLFLSQSDEEGANSYLGGIFIAPVMTGADDGTMERFKAALSMPMKSGSFIQIAALNSPGDVEKYTNTYLRDKFNATGVLRRLSQDRATMLQDATESALRGMNGVLINEKKIIVAFNVPCEIEPTEADITFTSDIATKLREALRSAGLFVNPVGEQEYLRITRTLFDMYGKHKDYDIDPYTPIREQVFAPASDVQFEKDHISFNDETLFCKILSVKNYPKRAGIGIMNMIVGDPFGSANQITDPYFMSTIIYYPDQDKKIGELRRGHAWITNQAVGNMLSMIPLLGYKKHGYDTMIHELDGTGGVICEVNFSIVLYSKTMERLNGVAAALNAWAGSLNFDLREDKRILKALFLNLVPLNISVEGVKNLFRFNTMAITHAIRFLPVLHDWTGSGNGGCSIYASRRGAPVLFDPYDSDTNYNGIIFAESGGGKSFQAQQLLCDLLSGGARAWVMDQGRSYEKLCSVIDGQFIEFSETSHICLNPFTFINDIDEEMDLLKSMLAKMAAPEKGLTDFEMSILEQAIKGVWGTYSRAATITDIQDWLLAQPDKEIKNLGSQLFTFTRRGAHGRWFDGPSNIDFSKDFVVLELQELASKKTLQQVVLLLLFDRIGTEMYAVGKTKKKILLIDESWALLDDPIISKAIEAGYRKVRKGDGAVWVVTQSITDVHESTSGRVILANCAWQAILRQKSESIDASTKDGLLKLDEYTSRMLKSVHTTPGSYSEMMIRRSEGDWGVVKFIASRFAQILFSTKGWERTEVLEVAQAKGDVVAFIDNAIKEGR